MTCLHLSIDRGLRARGQVAEPRINSNNNSKPVIACTGRRAQVDSAQIRFSTLRSPRLWISGFVGNVKTCSCSRVFYVWIHGLYRAPENICQGRKVSQVGRLEGFSVLNTSPFGTTQRDLLRSRRRNLGPKRAMTSMSRPSWSANTATVQVVLFILCQLAYWTTCEERLVQPTKGEYTRRTGFPVLLLDLREKADGVLQILPHHRTIVLAGRIEIRCDNHKRGANPRKILLC